MIEEEENIMQIFVAACNGEKIKSALYPIFIYSKFYFLRQHIFYILTEHIGHILASSWGRAGPFLLGPWV